MSHLEPEILYQDKDLLAINKPAGLLVHSAKVTGYQSLVGSSETLVDWLLANFPEVINVGDDPQMRPGIVHRLDKDTSGAMIIARNQATFDYLKNLFQTHQIKKTYLALVHGQVKENSGVIDKPLGIKSGTIKRTAHTASAKDIRPAITEYSCRKILGDYTLLEVHPKTGRTHQIRVHLASIGHPIVSDQLYGRKNDKQLLGRQFLHAESIEFTTPSGSRLKISADLPEELEDFLRSLK